MLLQLQMFLSGLRSAAAGPVRLRLLQGRAAAHFSTLVLGIETSCDETGAAVLDQTGHILGESLHSQKEVHLRSVPQLLHHHHQNNNNDNKNNNNKKKPSLEYT